MDTASRGGSLGAFWSLCPGEARRLESAHPTGASGLLTRVTEPPPPRHPIAGRGAINISNPPNKPIHSSKPTTAGPIGRTLPCCRGEYGGTPRQKRLEPQLARWSSRDSRVLGRQPWRCSLSHHLGDGGRLVLFGGGEVHHAVAGLVRRREHAPQHPERDAHVRLNVHLALPVLLAVAVVLVDEVPALLLVAQLLH